MGLSKPTPRKREREREQQVWIPRSRRGKTVPWVVVLSSPLSLSPSLIFLLLSSLVSLRATVAPLSRPHRRTGTHENGRAPPYRRPSLFLFSSSGSRAPSRTSAVSPLPTMKDHDRPLRFKFLSGWTERRVSRPGNGNLPACGTRRNSSSRRRFDRLRRSTIVLFRFVSHLASFFFFSPPSLSSLSLSQTIHIYLASQIYKFAAKWNCCLILSRGMEIPFEGTHGREIG